MNHKCGLKSNFHYFDSSLTKEEQAATAAKARQDWKDAARRIKEEAEAEVARAKELAATAKKEALQAAAEKGTLAEALKGNWGGEAVRRIVASAPEVSCIY